MRTFVGLFRNLFPCMLIVLVSLGLQPGCHAEPNSATISIQIEDPSGARIPNATVAIRNLATNQEQEKLTTGQGSVSFPFLKPGKYSLLVTRDGFARISVDNIALNVGDERALKLILSVASGEQTINVDGSGMTLNTADGSVSTVVDRKFVENIPLNGRSFQDLILLTPGVVTNSPQSAGSSGYSGEFSVNGQRTESNVYTVDGVNANTGGYVYGYGTPGTSGSLPAATALGTTQSLMSVDALQEFRVESSSYSAQYGLSPGGQFSFHTRSGTNEFHGTAFDFLRNNYFDSNDWFNDSLGVQATALRQNDFGGTLGGPIRIPKLYNGENKSFFFFSYEGLRVTQPQAAQINYVPSLGLRQSAASALQPALNAFPLPTGAPLANGLAPFVMAYSLPSSLDSTSLRIDQKIATKLNVFFRFSDTPSITASRYLSNLSSTRQSSSTYTLGATAVLSPALVNEFRGNYSLNRGSSSSTIDTFGGAQATDFLQLQGIDQHESPSAQANFNLFFPGYYLSLVAGTISQPQHSWNINDSIAISRGRSLLKVGGDYRRITSDLQQSSPSVIYVFNNSQGLVSNKSSYEESITTARSYPAYTNAAFYLQDETRATDRLSISLGLRWELNPPPNVTSGSLPYIAQGDPNSITNLALAPAGQRFWKTTYFNFAPRLGVAYQARNRPGKETIIRAGGGVFFDSGQQASTLAFGNSPGQSVIGLYRGASYPLPPSKVNVTLTNPPVAPYAAPAYYFPSRMQLPYSFQWNASLEQSLGRSQSLSLSYVGSNGRRLLSQLNVYPATGDFSNYGIEIVNTGTTSSYNALQVKFQRTLSRGLQVLAAYTWAHAIDFGSQNLAYSPVRGAADFDLRSNFNLAATYELPSTDRGKMLRVLTNHWAIDGRYVARTAFPVTLNGNYISDASYSGYSSLDVVPGVPLYVHVHGIAGNRQINPAAFALPSGNDFGNAPRNLVRGFGQDQLDTAVRRTFPIFEHLNLQFRAEAFNLLNHPNFGYIDPNYGDNQFGQATRMLNQSLGNLSPLYQQGGPRSMQFALKLMF